MSSGGKRIVTNLRERPVSTDLNRLQAFAAADVAQILRFLADGNASVETGAGGIENTPGTAASPMRAIILGGLRCQPQAGVTDLLVTPGVLVGASIDAVPDADDSPYKWVDDPGVTTLGALNLTPNGGGSPRIDVVECRIVDSLLTSENRQTWDETAHAFGVAAPVEKTRARRLEYRIRDGVVGAGFPGTATGWLPLMVVSAPAGAATWNDCVLWDVRPLYTDIVLPGGQHRDWISPTDRQYARSTFQDPTTPTYIKVFGYIEGTFGKWRSGGYLDTVADALQLDLLNTENHDTVAVPFLAHQPFTVWAHFPFGLPRWCKYTTALEVGYFRGIPIVSRTGPENYRAQRPAAAIAPAASLGLGASASSQLSSYLFSGLTSSSAGSPFGVEIEGSRTHHVVWAAGDYLFAPTSTVANTSMTWQLSDSTQFPKNARRLRIRLSAHYAGIATPGVIRRDIERLDSGGTWVKWSAKGSLITGGNAAAAPDFTDEFEVEVPPEPMLDGTTYLKWTNNSGAAVGAVASAGTLQILGWET